MFAHFEEGVRRRTSNIAESVHRIRFLVDDIRDIVFPIVDGRHLNLHFGPIESIEGTHEVA